MRNVRRFCVSLANRLPNLQLLSFTIYGGPSGWTSKRSDYADGGIKCSERLVSLLHFLVDHLRQLVWFRIRFRNIDSAATAYFPDQFQQQLHARPLNQPHRRRFSSNAIEIWL